MLQQNTFGERFYLRTRSVYRPAMRISVKRFYICQLETALHIFLREVRNIFPRICNIFKLYYN